MATTKPRITITLEPHRHELLRRLAEYQGVSMSAIVADLVESVSPVLERVCVAIESARKAQEGVRENLVRVAEESERALMPHLEAAIGQLDIFLGQCEQAGQQAEEEAVAVAAVRGARKRPRAGVAATADDGQDPRPVITGVRSGDKPRKVADKTPRQGRRS
jgi:hypothetical protein